MEKGILYSTIGQEFIPEGRLRCLGSHSSPLGQWRSLECLPMLKLLLGGV